MHAPGWQFQGNRINHVFTHAQFQDDLGLRGYIAEEIEPAKARDGGSGLGPPETSPGTSLFPIIHRNWGAVGRP